MGRELSLEEVSKEYPIMLLDTSVLLGELGPRSEEDIEKKILKLKREMNSAIFFREFLESGGDFYLIPNILKEYLSGTNYSYKKIIKKNGGHIQRERLFLMRKIRDSTRERRKLASLLEERGKILKFEENEREKYEQFSHKHHALMKEEGIGINDYDLLVSGLTIAAKMEPTCIISNDFPLLYSWRKVLKIEGIGPNQLGFFVRKNFNGFRIGYL